MNKTIQQVESILQEKENYKLNRYDKKLIKDTVKAHNSIIRMCRVSAKKMDPIALAAIIIGGCAAIGCLIIHLF